MDGKELEDTCLARKEATVFRKLGRATCQLHEQDITCRMGVLCCTAFQISRRAASDRVVSTGYDC